jgi:hypothetical protein
MFKKLFNAITGNNESEATPAASFTPAQAAPQQVRQVSYDPETLHGTHYTETSFDAEVESRAEAWIAQERADGETLSQRDVDNIYFNYRREVYQEWNNCDSDQTIRFEHANSMKYTGVQTSGFIKTDDNNPYLEPVHGISLRDYAAMAIKISQGIDYLEVCKAMGIEPAIWEELNTIWPQRMGQDTSFTVTTLYGQYFAENATNPKLEALKVVMTESGAANLEKIRTDRYLYEELAGARQAAYEYGLDGAQWILDNYGINLADFQSAAMKWMTEQNQNWNSEDIMRFHDYQQAKQKEYAAKFAGEQGGNVADDISF